MLDMIAVVTEKVQPLHIYLQIFILLNLRNIQTKNKFIQIKFP